MGPLAPGSKPPRELQEERRLRRAGTIRPRHGRQRPNMKSLTLLALLLFAPQVSHHKDTDTVRLKDGSELVGRVVYEDDSTLLMRVRKQHREIAMSEVAEVSTLERSQRELFGQLDVTSAENAGALVDLATFAASRGLPSEARLVCAKAIFADNDNAAAFRGLEGREHEQKGWQVKIGKRWRTLAEVQELHGKWRDHFEIETTHFIVRSDMPAERVVDLALDVERYYLAFYEVLGTRLRLQTFDTVPIVSVYEEAGRMPKPPVASDAWFAEARNELDVQATEDVSRELIAREMTRLMLTNSLRKTYNKAGDLSPWASRGVANMLSSAVIIGKRPMTFDFARVYPEWFQTQASTPTDLRRVLALSEDEFWDAKSDANDAAAYTLVHFLVHGEGGKWFEGFRNFLESSYLGKGSATHFARALGLDGLETFEASWNEYVRAKANI